MNSVMSTSALLRAVTAANNTHAIHQARPTIRCIDELIASNLQTTTAIRKFANASLLPFEKRRTSSPAGQRGILPPRRNTIVRPDKVMDQSTRVGGESLGQADRLGQQRFAA